MAAAEPSDTPEQSKTPSTPAMGGELAMVSMDTSLRNWARGLRAPLQWFFQAMRVEHLLQLVRVDAVLVARRPGPGG